MTTHRDCPTCGASTFLTSSGVLTGLFGGAHKCPPMWRVWCPDQGEDGPDDGRDIRAVDAAAAVEEWAEQDDINSADYSIVGGATERLHVQDGDDVLTFDVTGRAEPVYTATEAHPDQECGARHKHYGVCVSKLGHDYGHRNLDGAGAGRPVEEWEPRS